MGKVILVLVVQSTVPIICFLTSVSLEVVQRYAIYLHSVRTVGKTIYTSLRSVVMY